jgi:hypothetical protein
LRVSTLSFLSQTRRRLELMTMSSSYTVKLDSRVITVSDANVAESYSKAGHKVTARNERGTYLGGSDA